MTLPAGIMSPDAHLSELTKMQLAILDLEKIRRQIIVQLEEVERSLPKTKKGSLKREELIERKNILLANLREQKVRLCEARQIRHEMPRDHPVTDHALIRWLERKHGVDIIELKGMMLTPALQAALASSQERWSDGEMLYVLKDRMVITVLPACGLRSEEL